MNPDDVSDEPAQPGVTLKAGPEGFATYRGRIVAIVDGEIRVAGKTWGECLKAAKEAHLHEPLFFAVPAGALIA